MTHSVQGRPNCVLVALVSAAFAGCGSSNHDDCATKLQAYDSAVRDAMQCNPGAAVPCAPYEYYFCGPVGVNPDSTTALSTILSEYLAAGCTLPVHQCPIVVVTPPPYTCQPGAGGGNQCYSLCENMPTGTCVSQSTGCANLVFDAFCSGTSMECCSSY